MSVFPEWKIPNKKDTFPQKSILTDSHGESAVESVSLELLPYAGTNQDQVQRVRFFITLSSEEFP